MASKRSKQVVKHYVQDATNVMKLFRWFRPAAYSKAAQYINEVLDLAETLRPVLPEEHLTLLQGSRAEAFDASLHPQINYTEALCRRWLSSQLS